MTAFGLGSLHLRKAAQSRSLSAENPTGEPGQGGRATLDLSNPKIAAGHPARALGQGWKVRPCIRIKAGETATLMDHDGPGVIRHIWMTFGPERQRALVIRIYWDGQETPSVECPLGDFFCVGWNKWQTVLAQPVNANPAGGLNFYFPMPFKSHARIEIANEGETDEFTFFYQIDYSLEEVPEDALYLHAHWRRANPLAEKTEFVMLDGVKGAGHFVGTFMCWQQNTKGWWGEGEIKFHLDGDREFPTICGTGTEDYFGGAWCYVTARAEDANILTDAPADCVSSDYSAPYLGWQQVEGRNLEEGCRMTLYRFHALDPVFFSSELKITIQALGWHEGFRFRPLEDDLSAVSYWYQTLPSAPLPPLPPFLDRAIAPAGN